jgi:hypothetical protein
MEPTMTHGPEHHIEHAEHAAHASHDDFNKRVTMSIAIVAAVLACVTMLGHRSHNETLRLQGEALALQTKASIQSTQTANKWAYYQSKNIFNLESDITSELLDLLPIREDRKEKFDKVFKKHKKNVEEYRGTGTKDDLAKYKTVVLSEEEQKQLSDDEKKKIGKLKLTEWTARKLDEEAQHMLDESKKIMEQSHFEHQKAARLDYGELGLQFGVVLCSLAILTKSTGFWIGGLISSLIGALVAMTGQFGLFLGGHH